MAKLEVMKQEEARDPETPAEWQDAVDTAEFLMMVDSAMQYGLVKGPKVNIERCEEILREGKKRGFEARAYGA